MGSVNLRDTLQQAATKMRQSSEQFDQLDDLLGETFANPSKRSSSDLKTLQSMDLLRQEMDCFAVLLANLAETVDPTLQLSASAVNKGLYLESFRNLTP